MWVPLTDEQRSVILKAYGTEGDRLYVKRNEKRSPQFPVHKPGNLNERETTHRVRLSERNLVAGY